MKKCIVILGMHRSGTSAIMGVLNLLRVDLSLTLMKPAEENPKGFFENHFISQVDDRILKYLISSWDELFSLPENWWDQEWLEVFRKEIIEIFEKEFKAEIIGIKDPRISALAKLELARVHCELFPDWIVACAHARS